MLAPNLFLIYVDDVNVSAEFYGDLFEMKPSFVSPRYVAFEIAPKVLFALWSGHKEALGEVSEAAIEQRVVCHRGEVGLMIPGDSDDIDALFESWRSKGVRIVSKPYDEVFGRTFVVADPDGNLIRVSPVD